MSLHQGLGTHDGDHTLQIVGQNVEAHLRSDLFEGSGLEVGGAHPGFEGAEWVFVAKNYIDNLSEEARKGMQEKAEQGIWPTKTPLGYRNIIGPDGKKIIAVDRPNMQQ